MSDEPPILPVGTAVSAKYKGAFCEAKVSKVIAQLRYRVTFKEPHMGTDTLKEEYIKASGVIRVGRTVLAWHHGQKTFLEAQVTRIQDQSQYTVVFDDGDITTLRRNYLCLKSGRHFNESETLDQLPLTHPEHFSNPVVGGRSRRRNRNRGDDSEGEHEEADPEMEGYHNEVGRVVWGENLEKKRNRDWPPGLIMLPKNPKILNTKEEFLIRSFKDDRFYNVPKKEVIEFNKEVGEKLEKSNTPFYIGVQKALRYLNTGELPANWEKHFLFHSDRIETDPELNFSDSSDDEPCEEKDRFVAQLYKFLDEAGTPLNKTPTIGGEDVDLYRLFSVVNKLGGYNKVSNNNKWKSVTGRLKYGNSQSLTNQVKQVYKKCLLSFEAFYKTLGVTMLNHTKSSKKNKGRSLIRDKDRATPIINSPRPDKEDEHHDRKEDEKTTSEEKEKAKRRPDVKDDRKKKEVVETSGSSSDTTDQTEASTSKDTGRPRRLTEVKSWAKEKKIPKVAPAEKVKTVVEKCEENSKNDDEKEKVQQTRSKSQLPKLTVVVDKKPETKTPSPKDTKESKESKDIKDNKGQLSKMPKKEKTEEDKDKTKRARKRSLIDSDSSVEHNVAMNISIGDKLKVYYGPSIESKITYEAKVVEIDKEGAVPLYLVHYTGWNTRYDEWVGAARVAENLSAATKAKRLKQGTQVSAASVTPKSSNNTPTVTTAKASVKKKKSFPETRRTSSNELPRSTTPLSSTSTSSRPKTPATPATRSSTRGIKQDQKRIRRTSVQTDTSVHTDSESPVSESEPELSRTRSGVKSEETEIKTYKKKVPRIPAVHKARTKTRDEDDDTEREEDQPIKERPKRTRKFKRTPEKMTEESDDEGVTLPKGRDFDLNQIRSELKGFSKVVPITAADSVDKDSSSDESAKPLIKLHITAEEDGEDDFGQEQLDKLEEIILSQSLEKSSSCDDIYEFKEPEPFEFESRSTLTEEKGKKRLTRFYEDDKSPNKSGLVKSPTRSESSVDIETKVNMSPVKSSNSEEEEEDDIKPKIEKEDPFDKLVESPCYNMGKTSSPIKSAVMIDDPLVLFGNPPETADDCSRDMELSDTESQTQPIITTRNDEVFSDAFTKSSSEQNTLDLEFPKSEDRNVDEEIQASIQRVIEQVSSTDDDTRDALLQVTLPITNYHAKKQETNICSTVLPTLVVQDIIKEPKVAVEKINEINEKSVFAIFKEISPVQHLPENECPSLLETINRQSQMKTCESPVNFIENKEVKSSIDSKNHVEVDHIEEKVSKSENEEVIADQEEMEAIKEERESTHVMDVKLDTTSCDESYQQGPETEMETEEAITENENKDLDSSTKEEQILESKKRRKVVSRPFIESDSDSSDSDNLVIARSDEESQSNSILDNKEVKDNWDSNMSIPKMPITIVDGTKIDQEEVQEQRNFKFENMQENESDKNDQEDNNDTKSVSDHMDIEEEIKEEEPDSHLDSMLLCEETIPRSPAPAAETTIEEPVRRSKSALEMPFASVPCSSNNKSLLLNTEPVNLHESSAAALPNEDTNTREDTNISMNSPPSSPETTISNLSPRDNNGGLSPDSRDIDNANDYQQKRIDSNKIMSYSEDDSQMACDPPKKNREDHLIPNAIGRKRRRSFRTSDPAPSKRGRRPANRSRHNSDSEEDTSDHSLISTSHTQKSVPYNRENRSERPLKYDFRPNLDGITDSNERINIILQKMAELKKVYMDVKAELADIERRRKKFKRRQREVLKTVKQVVPCT